MSILLVYTIPVAEISKKLPNFSTLNQINAMTYFHNRIISSSTENELKNERRETII